MSDKRKTVLNQNKKNISKKVIINGAVIGSILIFLTFSIFSIKNNHNKAVVPSFTSHKTVSANNGIIQIVLSDLDNNKAHFYRYKFIDKYVDFFLLKSNDGVIRAAFDACDVCFRAKKGYKQDGDYMICANCGQTFASSRINEVKGGCNPSPLERNIVGDNIEINVSDLFRGKILF